MDAYGYCYQNPVNLVDPDGREGTDWIQRGSDVFFDPKVAGQAQTEEVQGKNAKSYGSAVQIIAKNGSYTFNLESDGNVSDKNGNCIDVSNDLQTPGGRTIHNPKNRGGEAFSISVGGLLGGSITLEAGIVKDATGDYAGFFSFKGNEGLGANTGVNINEILPQHGGNFVVNDFAGVSLEGSLSVNSPIGGGGLSFGGTSPEARNGIIDRFSNIGQDKRGYLTGSFTPGFNAPAPKFQLGATVSKSTTQI